MALWELQTLIRDLPNGIRDGWFLERDIDTVTQCKLLVCGCSLYRGNNNSTHSVVAVVVIVIIVACYNNRSLE